MRGGLIQSNSLLPYLLLTLEWPGFLQERMTQQQYLLWTMKVSYSTYVFAANYVQCNYGILSVMQWKCFDSLCWSQYLI